MTPDIVVRFWFEEIAPAQWWHADSDFDDLIRARFEPLHHAARRAELYAWRASAAGRLAEVLVLDQFPRNIYRGSANAFAADAIALVLAQEAVAQKIDRELALPKRSFLYMPFMHSESLIIHEQALTLFSQPGLESGLDFEIKHKRIIERFGRYPHRNAILGRTSTSEELEFLRQPDSSF